jgi:hypothetical protein
LAFEPRVGEQALGLRQPQPVGRLPEQPGGDAAAAMLLCDVQVADVGPPAVPGEPLLRLEGSVSM